MNIQTNTQALSFRVDLTASEWALLPTDQKAALEAVLKNWLAALERVSIDNDVSRIRGRVNNATLGEINAIKNILKL
ncbi:hypothetical protein [Caudoviricetes sp.]|nr:hypothetical protein [Caudoviricetes sp.]